MINDRQLKVSGLSDLVKYLCFVVNFVGNAEMILYEEI